MASCIIQIHTAPRDAIIVCALRTIQPRFAAPVNPDIYLCTMGWVDGWLVLEWPLSLPRLVQIECGTLLCISVAIKRLLD
jgi:hypothetical protein